MKKSLERKMNKLASLYPHAWFKYGEDFCSSHKDSIWTGEGSELFNGEAIFNYYGYPDTMGVHPKFVAALDKVGLWAEFYDGGTVFLYAK
jgi:hypothetical protein